MGKRSREKWERRQQGQQIPQKRWARLNSDFEKICLFIIRWGTYIVLFAPLVVVRESFFPFVTPKTIFFRVIVEIILVFYLFLAISNPRYRPNFKHPLTIAIFIFLAIFILTSITGVNPSRSFWSTYERMTGVFTQFHLFAFFIILTSCFREREDWENFLAVSIIVGVLLSIYVLSGEELSTRGGGTIGNTSFMGAYLLFNIFFAIILLFAKRDLYWQIFSGGSLAIMILVLITSDARGAIASFLGGLFLLTLGFLLFAPRKILNKIGIVIILALIIFGVASFVYRPPFIFNKIESTLQEMHTRFVVWEKGWKGWQERFWLGWGPENFPVVFLKNFNPCMFVGECGGEIWFDRAHNIIFDTVTNSGLIGLLSYLLIFVVAIFLLLRTCRKVAEERNLFFPLGIGVLLIAYFVQNMLVFDMINSYLVFFLSLGFIYFLTAKSETLSFDEFLPKPKLPVFEILIIVAVATIMWFGNIQPGITAVELVQSISSPNAEKAVLHFKNSLNSLMEKYEPREQFSQKITFLAFDPQQNRDAIQKGFELATAEMEKSIQENSLDFRPHLFLGRLYLNFYYFSQNLEKLSRAEEVLEKAMELSPTNQQGYWYLAEVKVAQGKIEEGIDLFKKAIELEPRLGKSHWFLSVVYGINNENDLAFEKLKEAETLGYNWRRSLQDFKQAIEIHRRVRPPSELIPLYQEALELSPQDIQLLTGLIQTHLSLAQFEKAEEIVQKLKEIRPDLASQFEETLKNLKAP